MGFFTLYSPVNTENAPNSKQMELLPMIECTFASSSILDGDFIEPSMTLRLLNYRQQLDFPGLDHFMSMISRSEMKNDGDDDVVVTINGVENIDALRKPLDDLFDLFLIFDNDTYIQCHDFVRQLVEQHFKTKITDNLLRIVKNTFLLQKNFDMYSEAGIVLKNLHSIAHHFILNHCGSTKDLLGSVDFLLTSLITQLTACHQAQACVAPDSHKFRFIVSNIIKPAESIIADVEKMEEQHFKKSPELMDDLVYKGKLKSDSSVNDCCMTNEDENSRVRCNTI